MASFVAPVPGASPCISSKNQATGDVHDSAKKGNNTIATHIKIEEEGLAGSSNSFSNTKSRYTFLVLSKF